MPSDATIVEVPRPPRGEAAVSAVAAAGTAFLKPTVWRVAFASLRLPGWTPHPGSARMARASRRHAHEEEQRRLEESRRSGGEEQVSPFAGIPFGGIFEEMFRGIETRSYRIDPETGEWVEMSDELPTPELEHEAEVEGSPGQA